jgi:site-specific recombinase XerD
MLPSISVVLRTDRKRKGKSQIAIQIRYKNQRRQVFTGLFVDKGNFNKGIISGTNAEWYNASIKKKIAELEAEYLKTELNGNAITLASKVSGRRSFIQYAKDFYQSRGSCSPDYKIRAVAAIAHLEAFAGQVSFEQLTPQLLKDFEASLSLSRNTVNRIFKRIKQPCKMAMIEGLMIKNPFIIYQPPTYQQPKRDFLTLEEIGQIEVASLAPMFETVRAYFLLSCFTGLRYSDLSKFDKAKDIIHSKGVARIIIGTTKTKEVVSIKLTEKVRGIIDIITEPIPSNVHCNRVLKDICATAELKRHVNFHMARHSFAVNSAILGIPIEAVAKLLGHNSIRTTQIYYKIVDTKIDEYMDRWDVKTARS